MTATNPHLALSRLAGTGVYVPGNDIDTDRIIPARYLRCVTFDDLGPALFYDQRFTETGASKQHPLDAPAHQGAEILITDMNFGCGSSREHAPQALHKFGIKAIIAGSFAEIFQGNCTTLGLPCLVMPEATRQALAQSVVAHPELALSIDLEKMQVLVTNSTTNPAAKQVYAVSMKTSSRQAFLAGTYDPLEQLLGGMADIQHRAQALGYI